MPSLAFEFKNAQNETLIGRLDTPDSEPVSYAIFAHCFTCGKDIAAASRIARALAKDGIAVLRFDFTGLGSSDGDFANTNFSSNVQDLVFAAKALEEQYQAPSLLVGHSLGGAAVLSAASGIDSIEVNIGVQKFTIKKQLVDDLDKYSSTNYLSSLNLPVLVMHSPIDSIVGIDEAAKIYQSASHPKSFISLDTADHLLSDKQDSEYVAATLCAWASRYMGIDLDIVANQAS